MEEPSETPSKESDRKSAPVEKKKSWFSFGSSGKKVDSKKDAKPEESIPVSNAHTLPMNSGSEPESQILSPVPQKKSWFSFGTGKKTEGAKPESKVGIPPVLQVEAPINTSPPAVPELSIVVVTPEIKQAPEVSAIESKGPVDVPTAEEKKPSRFGFVYKGKTGDNLGQSPSVAILPKNEELSPPVDIPATPIAQAPAADQQTTSPTPELPSVDPVALGAIQKLEEKRSRHIFSFGSRNKDTLKLLKPRLENEKKQKGAVPQPSGDARKPDKKKFGQKTNKKIVGRKEKVPQELVHITGNKVLIPTFEEFEKLKNITYPVKEPFQYVNLVEQDGEIVYNALEPRLTKKEKAIHKKVMTAYDLLVNVGTVLVDVEDRVRFLEETYKEIIDIYNIRMSPTEYQRILYFIERDYTRYGRADPLISDRFIEDISCNGPGTPVFVYHRFFESIRTNIVFEELELNNFILRLAQLSGRHISILQPIRDAALPDGSRVNMTLGKEVTKKGSTFTIRKFRAEPISPIEIASLRTATTSMLAYLWLLVEYEQSFLISGGTASGKTTLLNAISMLIRPENKIVSVEDTPEINLAHPNWIQAVTRVGFGESGGGVSGISGLSGVGPKGKSAGDITLYDLLIAALRQRPDYIIVGEVRGEEAYTLFQAISVGHAAMGTVHAASMVELLARIESMPMNVPRVLVANLDIVIFLGAIRRGEEKVRRVREIVEILGIDPGTKELITNTVFRWDPVTDNVEYLGRSFIVEKISKSFGIPKEDLEKEIAKRQALLDDLKARGIVHYKEVTEAVRQYYLQREAQQSEMDARKRLLGTPVEVNAKNSL